MIDSIADRLPLNNGTEMPGLGLGVFKMSDDEVKTAVAAALDTGYRSIDTAAVYGNEEAVGAAMAASSVAREDIFLTTKVWNEEQRKSNARNAFEESLKRLNTDYVDLYLIHWPVKEHYVETWKVLEDIYDSGRAKAIGVSNFLPHHLDDLLSQTEIVPAVNQVEFHPYLVQPDLKAYCAERDIRVEAWSPLMQGHVGEDETITKLAAAHGKSPAQIVLRWNIQHGVVTIPKSSRPERVAENAALFDFALSDEEMAALDALDRDHRYGSHPDTFKF